MNAFYECNGFWLYQFHLHSIVFIVNFMDSILTIKLVAEHNRKIFCTTNGRLCFCNRICIV